MERYVALLRGININGKNKIQMGELAEGFHSLNFQEVKTYLNTGNVIFSCFENDTATLRHQIESMIKSNFRLDIPVFVIPIVELEEILHCAPRWWGNKDKEMYDNLIFMIPPATFSEVYDTLGQPNIVLESIENVKNAIFWSFNRERYQKTNWWSKTISSTVAKSLTIRSANTVRKLIKM
ncbi:DUF1697 domain-containing protein [Streptococcus sp. X16XC17]|uniref:DUF1697 domain-containing protein n=1 Tax=unclassified Streptococcus TaxID=2608887 RepID=UPI00066FEC27|nr:MULTISPECIES: DUF1697 domain-containing protein [unclassified Streptococcus]TCD46067.1 DUF1697 domain-containing protein [Streptococcus sp. X16XC17]